MRCKLHTLSQYIQPYEIEDVNTILVYLFYNIKIGLGTILKVIGIDNYMLVF